MNRTAVNGEYQKLLSQQVLKNAREEFDALLADVTKDDLERFDEWMRLRGVERIQIQNKKESLSKQTRLVAEKPANWVTLLQAEAATEESLQNSLITTRAKIEENQGLMTKLEANLRKRKITGYSLTNISKLSTETLSTYDANGKVTKYRHLIEIMLATPHNVRDALFPKEDELRSLYFDPKKPQQLHYDLPSSQPYGQIPRHLPPICGSPQNEHYVSDRNLPRTFTMPSRFAQAQSDTNTKVVVAPIAAGQPASNGTDGKSAK